MGGFRGHIGGLAMLYLFFFFLGGGSLWVTLGVI